MIKDKIIYCFNTGAKTYDQAADVQVYSAKKLALLLPALSPERILEIGCGTGIFSQYFIQKYPLADILLVDISKDMLAISHKKWIAYPHVSLLCNDGENIAEDCLYDLIVSNMTFHWFLDLVVSIEKLIDQLSHGGQLIFSLLGENTLKEWRQFHPTLVFPAYQLLKKRFPQIKFNVECYSLSYPNVYQFLKTLKNIGGTATHLDLQPSSVGTLRQLLRTCSQPFDVTYEIIYGEYLKQ